MQRVHSELPFLADTGTEAIWGECDTYIRDKVFGAKAMPEGSGEDEQGLSRKWCSPVSATSLYINADY